MSKNASSSNIIKPKTPSNKPLTSDKKNKRNNIEVQ